MPTRIFSLLVLISLPAAAQTPVSLENQALRLEVNASTGAVTLIDRATNVAWSLGTPSLVMSDKRSVAVRPAAPPVRDGASIRYKGSEGTSFTLRLNASPAAVDYTADSGPAVAEVHLLHQALPLSSRGDYYAAPHRLGVLLPVDGDKPYNRRMRAYETGRGYSMAMFGAVQGGSALLLSWSDPYTEILVDYGVEPARRLTMGLALRKSARTVRLRPLGRGGYVEIAKAYRAVAKERGYLKTLAEKMKENPRVADFFGAADFKPFAYMPLAPNTRWNKKSEWVEQFNFSFDECAALAEHMKNDLGIDRAMLVLNGWINGGYDNKHPDILPAAARMGGNEGLRDCSRRVKKLGWMFGLHDNYQDMYKEAPSFHPDYIMKNADGSLHEGGVWAGGLCWLVCSPKSIELAKRPQNIAAVKEIAAPSLYFSDTIFASPPYECFDPKHPLTLADDIRYKQQLCDYMRREIGLFGSEEGREWGVPHADYFEGLMSHRTRFQRPNDTDVVIPLFEIVFGDAIPLYTHQSDRPRPDQPEFILHHILYAEMPVYDFGEHRYWLDPKQEFQPKPGTDPRRLVFARNGKFGLTDNFIRNTYQILSPLHRLTALMPMTDHRFLTPDRKVEATRFGNSVRIAVNYGESDYKLENAVLPPYGFLIESPDYIACFAKEYRGKTYTEPTVVRAYRP